MSKDLMPLERLSTAKELLENTIAKTERAIKLLAPDSRVHEILNAANLEKCCSFVKDTNDISTARRTLQTSLNDLYTYESTLVRCNADGCKDLEAYREQINEIIQARKLLKCIYKHNFKEALKIAKLDELIKETTPWISRICLTENTFVKNLDKYLEAKWKDHKIILKAYDTEVKHAASTLEPSPSTPFEGSSSCNNTYVTDNNHSAADSTQSSVLSPAQHLYPLLSPDITTTSHSMNFPPKARKLVPAPPIPPSAPPPYEAVHDASDEHTLLGDLHHPN